MNNSNVFLSLRRVEPSTCWNSKVWVNIWPHANVTWGCMVTHNSCCISVKDSQPGKIPWDHPKCPISLLSKDIGKKTPLVSHDLEWAEWETIKQHMGHRECPNNAIRPWDVRYAPILIPNELQPRLNYKYSLDIWSLGQTCWLDLKCPGSEMFRKCSDRMHK